MTHQSMNPQEATIVEGNQFEHFLVVQDPEGQQRFLLDSNSYTLGRSPDSNIILRSQSVSREHATLEAIKVKPPLMQVFRISDGTDKGKSTNGITINGKACHAWVLMTGDEIVFSSNAKAKYVVTPEPEYVDRVGYFLDCLQDLASTNRKIGKYSEAEVYLQQMLELNKQIYGESHLNVATCLTDLAALYYSQNFFDKTEELFLEAIALKRSLLGQNDPEVAMTILELAAIYTSQALYAKAEPLFLEALEIKRQVLGAEHPEVAASLVDFASIYQAQKRYLEVKSLYEQALKIYKHSLEPNHPNAIAVQRKLNKVKRKLRPKWLSWNVLVIAAFVLLSGVVAYSIFAPRSDISCVKLLPDGTPQSISGEECRKVVR